MLANYRNQRPSYPYNFNQSLLAITFVDPAPTDGDTYPIFSNRVVPPQILFILMYDAETNPSRLLEL